MIVWYTIILSCCRMNTPWWPRSLLLVTHTNSKEKVCFFLYSISNNLSVTLLCIALLLRCLRVHHSEGTRDGDGRADQGGDARAHQEEDCCVRHARHDAGAIQGVANLTVIVDLPCSRHLFRLRSLARCRRRAPARSCGASCAKWRPTNRTSWATRRHSPIRASSTTSCETTRSWSRRETSSVSSAEHSNPKHRCVHVSLHIKSSLVVLITIFDIAQRFSF